MLAEAMRTSARISARSPPVSVSPSSDFQSGNEVKNKGKSETGPRGEIRINAEASIERSGEPSRGASAATASGIKPGLASPITTISSNADTLKSKSLLILLIFLLNESFFVTCKISEIN